MRLFGKVRSGTPRTLVLLLAAVFLLLAIPPLNARAEGETAEDALRVYHWTSADEEQPAEYYRVYKGDEISGVPTFFSTPRDVYENPNADREIRIRFFRYYDSATEEQAAAFARYLLAQSKAAYRYAGWYWFQEPDYTYPSYYVYYIEGWDLSNPSLDLETLLDSGPWENENGVALRIHFIDYGNVIADEWEWITGDLGCSTAVYIDRNGRRGVTLGFAFTNSETGRVLRRYCPNERG